MSQHSTPAADSSDITARAARSPQTAELARQLGDHFMQIVVDALAAELDRLDERSPE